MRVQKERCTGCGYCLLTCPEEAISSDGWAVIDDAKCTDCNLCLSVCPNGALVAAGDLIPIGVRRLLEYLL